MENKYLKYFVIVGLLGIYSYSFSQKIKHEITIKGVIENIEEIKPYLIDGAYLQLVEYNKDLTVGTTIKTTIDLSSGNRTRIETTNFFSSFTKIDVPLDGIVEYKVNDLKYGKDYIMTIQMIKLEYSPKPLFLFSKKQDSYEAKINISKKDGKLKKPIDLNLGTLRIIRND